MTRAARQYTPSGTRFLLYPQAPIINPEREPEVVIVSSPAGSVGPGPEDDRMYAINPADKWPPYGMQTRLDGTNYLHLPPWEGDIYPPPVPDADGHFDHIDPESREFQAAHLFGCVRFVLDIWETYFGHRIDWHFGDAFEKMELVNLPEYDNGHIGYGFLEVGSNLTKGGIFTLDCTNFDVIAHEVGHGIIYSMVGVPDPDKETGEYNGFHESAADLVAIVSCLHFDSVMDELLNNTHGNLYMLNRLNRIAELSENEQIRIASNPLTMSRFIHGWRKEHKLSQPLTGAIFDVLVDIFHEQLLDRGLISPEVEDLADQYEYDARFGTDVQALFDRAYVGNETEFRDALRESRDIMGTFLAETWRRLPPDHLTYQLVGEILSGVDGDFNDGGYHRIIASNFDQREIGMVTVGPQLAKLPKENHMDSSRRITPDSRELKDGQKMSYFERMRAARRLSA
jgi:hypothetical protein